MLGDIAGGVVVVFEVEGVGEGLLFEGEGLDLVDEDSADLFGEFVSDQVIDDGVFFAVIADENEGFLGVCAEDASDLDNFVEALLALGSGFGVRERAQSEGAEGEVMKSKDAEDAVKEACWGAAEIMERTAALVVGGAKKCFKKRKRAVDGFDFADIIEEGLFGEFGFLCDVSPDQGVIEIGDHMDALVCVSIDEKTVVGRGFVAFAASVVLGFDGERERQDPGCCGEGVARISVPAGALTC